MPLDTTTPARVRHVLARTLGRAPSAVMDDSHLRDDLGADSLLLCDVALALEEEFDLPHAFSDHDLETAHTVTDVIALVDRAQDAQRLAGVAS